MKYTFRYPFQDTNTYANINTIRRPAEGKVVFFCNNSSKMKEIQKEQREKKERNKG